jgi:hypothetical protein
MILQQIVLGYFTVSEEDGVVPCHLYFYPRLIESTVLLAGIFFIAGIYMAVQEALEPTVTAEMVQTDTLAMSYGALGTVNGTAKFISSATVGVIWTMISPVLGFGLAAGMMMIGTLALLRVRKD